VPGLVWEFSSAQTPTLADVVQLIGSNPSYHVMLGGGGPAGDGANAAGESRLRAMRTCSRRHLPRPWRSSRTIPENFTSHAPVGERGSAGIGQPSQSRVAKAAGLMISIDVASPLL